MSGWCGWVVGVGNVGGWLGRLVGVCGCAALPKDTDGLRHRSYNPARPKSHHIYGTAVRAHPVVSLVHSSVKTSSGVWCVRSGEQLRFGAGGGVEQKRERARVVRPQKCDGYHWNGRETGMYHGSQDINCSAVHHDKTAQLLQDHGAGGGDRQRVIEIFCFSGYAGTPIKNLTRCKYDILGEKPDKGIPVRFTRISHSPTHSYLGRLEPSKKTEEG